MPASSQEPLAQSPALRVRGLSKRYGATIANDSVNLDVYSGEVLAILGENGAGKSTLVNVLSGLVRPDHGTVEVSGSRLIAGDPEASRRSGIGVVHQHFMLVPDMTVAENVALALGRSHPWQLDLPTVRLRLIELGEEHGLPVRPDQRIDSLSVGERQRVEILKVLVMESRVLLLDEPSAVLTPQEWDRLADVIRGLAEDNLAVVLITHKLDEIASVADRCSVMRDGAVVHTVTVADTKPADLARLMVGRDVSLVSTRPTVELGEILLRTDGVTLRWFRGERDLGPICLEVRAGEVLGVAGVEGNGQSELAELLAGVRTPSSGTISVRSRTGESNGTVGFIAEDRQRDGLALSLSVRDNLITRIAGRPEFSRYGTLLRRRIQDHCTNLVARFNVRTASVDTLAGDLSGGNQQKIVLARELSQTPDLLVAAQPTRGLDVGAIEFVHEQINAHKCSGGATVLISAELEEIFALSDRIAVMSDGQITAILTTDAASRERVGELMGGMPSTSQGVEDTAADGRPFTHQQPKG